jgi:glutamine phosphoribosylpyrophosphate amidotransferase
MKTECGIFACIITSNLDKQKIYNAMSNIQHRGQDSYGYITITPNPNSKCRTGANINIIKEFGLLCSNQDFIYDDFIYEDNDKCLGKIFLGHMRYSTNTQLENNLLKLDHIIICILHIMVIYLI